MSCCALRWPSRARSPISGLSPKIGSPPPLGPITSVHARSFRRPFGSDNGRSSSSAMAGHDARAPVGVTLDDKYTLDRGRIYLTGIQALVRLPMMQRQLDLAAGLNTGGFISGYRGSPLGGFDQALWQAKRFIKKSHIEFQPGLNEDLAATALWGTQQIHLYPGAKYDGVFGMWYG